MLYQPADFSHLLGLPGFSDNLLKNHFKLYQGYVSNTNQIHEILDTDYSGKQAAPQYAELKRRFGWEFNGMRLHEYFFGNLSKQAAPFEHASPELAGKIKAEFGDFANWERDFRGIASMRGIGWAALACDKSTGHCFNVWINEHDTGVLAGSEILAIFDAFEHAYMIDYGLERGHYYGAFLKVLDWKTVSERFQGAEESASRMPELVGSEMHSSRRR